MQNENDYSLRKALWNDQRGQDVAEYGFILAVILVLVVGTVRLVGSNANNVFFFRLEFSSVSISFSSPVWLRVPKASGMAKRQRPVHRVCGLEWRF